MFSHLQAALPDWLSRSRCVSQDPCFSLHPLATWPGRTEKYSEGLADEGQEGPWVVSTKQACLGHQKRPRPSGATGPTFLLGQWLPRNPENGGRVASRVTPTPPPSTSFHPLPSCTRSQNGKKGHLLWGWGGEEECVQAYSPRPYRPLLLPTLIHNSVPGTPSLRILGASCCLCRILLSLL